MAMHLSVRYCPINVNDIKIIIIYQTNVHFSQIFLYFYIWMVCRLPGAHAVWFAAAIFVAHKAFFDI